MHCIGLKILKAVTACSNLCTSIPSERVSDCVLAFVCLCVNANLFLCIVYILFKESDSYCYKYYVTCRCQTMNKTIRKMYKTTTFEPIRQKLHPWRDRWIWISFDLHVFHKSWVSALLVLLSIRYCYSQWCCYLLIRVSSIVSALFLTW